MLVEHGHELRWQVVPDGVVVLLGAFPSCRALGRLLACAANLALEDALFAELALGCVLEAVAALLGFCLAGGAGDAAIGEQLLYPSEFLRFVRCEQVPLEWRQLVPLAIYTYVRDAELKALQCRDVDVEHRSIKVTKAIGKRTGKVKATKGRRLLAGIRNRGYSVKFTGENRA